MKKRLRLESYEESPQPPSESIRLFEGWLHENYIQIQNNKISINMVGDYWSITAVTDLHPEEPLAHIPKTAILSSKTTSFASIIKKERLGGGLALIAAVMHERALCLQSRWHGYLSTLPPHGEDLPLFWSEQELAALQGTEAEGRAAADLLVMKEDYEENIKPLISRHKKVILNPSMWGFGDFKIAASWLASRAFFVDEFHGQSLVPVADVFNHKASVVRLKEGYEVAELAVKEEEEDEDHEEEEEAEEEEAEEDHDDHEEEEEEDEEKLDQPNPPQSSSWFLAASQAARQAVSYAISSITGMISGRANKRQRVDQVVNEVISASVAPPPPLSSPPPPPPLSSPLSLEIAICTIKGEAPSEAGSEFSRSKKEEEMEGGSMLEIVAASEIKSGAEVHNTYGEYGNAELLIKYGFVLGEGVNPFDEVYLKIEQVVDSAKELQMKNGILWHEVGVNEPRVSEEVKRRMKMVEEQSSILDEEEADPVFLAPGGKVSRPLLVLLIALTWPFDELKRRGLSNILDQALELIANCRLYWAGKKKEANPELSRPPFDQLVDLAELFSSLDMARSLNLALLLDAAIHKRRNVLLSHMRSGKEESKRMQLARQLRETEVRVLDEASFAFHCLIKA